MSPGRSHLVPFGVLLIGVALCTVPAAAAADNSETSPQILFERAEALYRQLDAVNPGGDSAAWSEVAEIFELVVQRYPDSELASQALWRVAEIRSRQGEASDATGEALAAERRAYRELLRRYPLSPYAPETLLRLAILQEEHPESGASAADLYRRLMQEHPGTPQAEAARRRLASLPSERRTSSSSTSPDDASTTSRDDAPSTPGDAATSTADDDRSTRSLGQPAGPTADGDTSSSAGPSRQARPSGGDDRSGHAMPERSGDAAANEADVRARILDVRHYADSSHTRVVVELDRPVKHETGETTDPPRIFFDLMETALPDDLEGKRGEAGGLIVPGSGRTSESNVEHVRVAQNRPGVVRVVIDLDERTRYSMFTLDDNFRVVVDVPAEEVADRLEEARRPDREEGEESVSRQLRLGVHRIVIDPGHGGDDPGAIGRTGLTEKEIALDLSKRLAEMFQRNQGYEVLMTREGDRSVPLDERTEFANRAQADLFVSLHVNSSHNRKLSGFETYYLNLATDPAAAEVAARENSVAQGRLANLEDLLDRIVKNEQRIESRDLAQSIQDSLVAHVSKQYEEIRDLGVKQAPFFVLVGSKMPAVLVEASFLSHSEEAERLRDPDYRQQLAEALYIGIQSYVEGRRMAVYPKGYDPD